MGRLIDIKEASKLLGVNAKTLRRWDNEGELKPQFRTAGGHRRYNTDDINEYLGNKQIQQQTEKNVFIYCRVSTKKQQDAGNLQRQKDRLIQYCNAKIYGSRGGRKIKNNIEKSIQELEKERYENSDDNNTGSINKHI